MKKEDIITTASVIAAIVFLITSVILWCNKEVNPQVEVVKTTTNLTEWQVMEMAIIKTESEFNPQAIGWSKDVGIFQITPVYVEDVNRILGEERYTCGDAFSPARSLEMFEIYQNHYNPEHDILKAIHLHNPGGESIGYTKRVLCNMEYIRRYEQIRALVIESKH